MEQHFTEFQEKRTTLRGVPRLDCEQSGSPSLKSVGKNAKQAYARDCDRDVRAGMPRAVGSASVGRRSRTSRLQISSHVYLFCVFLSDFRGGETARSLYRHFRNFLNGNFCSIRLSLQKFRNFLVKGSLFGKPTPGLSSELFSENQFPDYLGTFSIHFSHFRNIRNFCLDGKHAKSRDKFAATVPGYSILPSNSG